LNLLKLNVHFHLVSILLNRFSRIIELLLILIATQNGTIINLKARCNKIPQNPINQQCWHLRYTGQTDLKEDKSKASMIRSYIDCITLNGNNNVNANLYEYLQSIGFGLDYEATIKGNIFHKGRLKIILSKIYLPVNNDLQPYTSSNFVEVTCVTPSGQVRS
jgi:mediator of RNA polymerase II transcription subunit 18